MNFLFLMDPLENVNADKDTSFAFMEGAVKADAKIFFLPVGAISNTPEGFLFNVTEVIPNRTKDIPFDIIKTLTLTENDVDAIFVRTDPPFNNEYLMQTWLLSLLPKRIVIVNNPNGIRTVNEKVWATQFKSIIPKTLVSQNKLIIDRFIKAEKKVIAKPTNGFGGQSIFVLSTDDPNLNVILENLTATWSEEIILQEYVPEAKNGDKRILLLDGEPLGAVLRIHSNDDHRNNFFAGGTAEKSEITKRDQEIIEILAPRLKELGLYFVGIDIIGDYLIEVNVTSPTCLQEMSRFNGEHLEDKVVDFVKNLVDQAKNLDTIQT